MNYVPQKHKRSKNFTKEELLHLEKNDLIEKIIQLEAHNTQLKNIINKSLSLDTDNNNGIKKKGFDFAKCYFRRVFLHILYFGWDYQGLAVQEDSNQTIEHHLFHALTKSCLIQSRETSQYHRCGRTDKGVSAFGQVISISLRSKYPPDEQDSEENIKKEIAYCKILNRLLPKDIRAVSWMSIPKDLTEYSARFDCKRRCYKYYFPRSSLNIAAMKEACSRVIGSNDYRHLCKMDVGNGVVEFRREIFEADIVAIDEGDIDRPTSMYCLVIEGNAFLWHQIRCIMGVLLLIGQGNESPNIISELLNVEKYPRKPQYNMALDIPLNLFHCSYVIEETNKWIYDKEELKSVIAHLQGDWTIHNIKATMIKDSLQLLEGEYSKLCMESEITDTINATKIDSIMCHADCLLQGVKPKVYKPLLKRETCSSLEERIEFYKKKRKLVINPHTKDSEEKLEE